MANAIYPKFKQAVLSATANSSLSGTAVKAVLVSSTYTYNSTHEFLSSVTGQIVHTAALTTKTVVNGTFDADNTVFTAAPTSNTGNAVILYTDTGSSATSRLVAYLDGMTNLPVVCNGGDINVTWDAAGIFTL